MMSCMTQRNRLRPRPTPPGVLGELTTIAERRGSPSPPSPGATPPTVRPLTPADRSRIEDLASRCSDETLRRRFHAPVAHLPLSRVMSGLPPPDPKTPVLRLPLAEVTVGAAWDDPDLARPFLDLFPPGTADRVSAEVRLAEVRQVGDDVYAVFVTEGTVGARVGGRIDVHGTAEFDARRGRLVRRELEARFETPTGADRLILKTELVASS